MTPVTSESPAQPVTWRNLAGCGDALALAQAIRRDRRLFLVVTEDTQTAVRLEHEIRFFLGYPTIRFRRCPKSFPNG
jgi:transcription-repair coupling factor (superfamily II helicase)